MSLPFEFLRKVVAIGNEAEELLTTRVSSGGDLQAALDKGGIIVLEPEATFEAARFIVKKSGTVIYGNSATLRGTSGPALHIPPSVNDVTVENLFGAASYSTVFQIGDNYASTQSTLEQVPQRITFRRVSVPTHRGQRGIEVNGAHVSLIDCSVADTYSPALQDSQGVFIMNTPGPVLIEGGSYSAASENILVGGDTMKIPGIVPSDITIRNTRLWKPISWRTDGVKRAVKNLLELKTGNRVTIQNVEMDGCWKDAQDGYAFVLTPRSGGAVTNVLIENVKIRNVSAGFQITGHDIPTKPPTPVRTTGIFVKNMTLITNRIELGGRGILALLGMGPDTVDFENAISVTDGSSLILGGDTERVGRVRFVDGFAVTGSYGIMGAGQINGNNWSTWVDVLDVQRNTFTGAATAFKTNFPSNTYVTREEFNALVAPRL